jgi:Beta-lactamase enzyme family
VRRRAYLFLLIFVLAASAPIGAKAATRGPAKPQSWHQRVRAAAAFLGTRSGSASFAMIDERGRVHGYRGGVEYSSASLVKAMLLVAYVSRRDVKRRELHPAERHLLGPMIRISDNDAATAVYERVGPSGLAGLAHRAGMRRFTPNPVWGGCQVTARDQARFFFRLARLLPERHRRYALGLLHRIDVSQRWGIPAGTPSGWRLYFKGGWFKEDDGWRVHQSALLRGGGQHLAIAVLSRGNPTLEYGAATISGVAGRLLHGHRP